VKRLYLFDDAKARTFEPFALTRPVSELRAGAELIRIRWETVARTKAYGFIGAPHLQQFEEGNAPPSVASESTIPAGSVVANSRFVPSLKAALDDISGSYACDGTVCAVRLRQSIDMRDLAGADIVLDALIDKDTVPTALAGRWLNEVWDLVGQLSEQLGEDIPVIGAALSGAAIENATLIGNHPVYLETGASIEPFVVIDASEGPVLIRRGATIGAFTKIVGPTYIGENSIIVGDAIRACSIGEVCKVRGEMSGSVMVGHSNKGHTGFIGSSYIGRWVNFGAGTTTSNLKNTYGAVHLETSSGTRNTGLQFLGSLVGDHAKTGIGTMLTTGCTVGAGANIFGSGSSPKTIPPFAWGASEPFARYDREKFTEVAERMMSRRHVALTDKGRQQLEEAYRVSGAAE
jgi:UDP-N-acetylglucosamine diphosphorylase / glucose-1-phosphate thymidylyltransferase / UDP-N-acetylgalactosamine diphosphorylase / glucosamine-1-phosphate N-acetyltransferase / galactosamine-1-phosphate N-acetyltransferase